MKNFLHEVILQRVSLSVRCEVSRIIDWQPVYQVQRRDRITGHLHDIAQTVCNDATSPQSPVIASGISFLAPRCMGPNSRHTCSAASAVAPPHPTAPLSAQRREATTVEPRRKIVKYSVVFQLGIPGCGTQPLKDET
jgi:hypothetical protein